MKGYEHLTEADARQLGRKAVATKPSKHRNVRVEVDGLKFQSKREADYWMLLKARERSGEIQQLERQVEFMLLSPTPMRDGAYMGISTYIADFVYYEHGHRRVVDAKGFRTAMYKLKRKWLELQDGIDIIEV